MKPVIFRWVKTSDTYFAQIVNSDAEYKARVEKSLKDLEDYLEELADKGDWEDISRLIPYDQFVKNDILINDIGNKDRMFIFVTLNEKSAEEIITSLSGEHYTHIIYLDLQGSMKG